MLAIALLILTVSWLAGGVIAFAVCRAAAEGDRTDPRTVRPVTAVAPGRRFSATPASRT